MHATTVWRISPAVRERVLGALLFAVLTAISARISVPIPFTPVPLTLQVLVVVMSGLVLGPWAALTSQALYLQSVLLGLPATSMGLAGPAAFVAPTSGYLLAFPLAAAIAGALAHRAGSHAVIRRAVASVAALVVIYALGIVWLRNFVGDLGTAWAMGVVPFLLPDALKLIIANAGLAVRRH